LEKIDDKMSNYDKNNCNDYDENNDGKFNYSDDNNNY
jgi:hypothetical protein